MVEAASLRLIPSVSGRSTSSFRDLTRHRVAVRRAFNAEFWFGSDMGGVWSAQHRAAGSQQVSLLLPDILGSIRRCHALCLHRYSLVDVSNLFFVLRKVCALQLEVDLRRSLWVRAKVVVKHVLCAYQRLVVNRMHFCRRVLNHPLELKDRDHVVIGLRRRPVRKARVGLGCHVERLTVHIMLFRRRNSFWLQEFMEAAGINHVFVKLAVRVNFRSLVQHCTWWILLRRQQLTRPLGRSLRDLVHQVLQILLINFLFWMGKTLHGLVILPVY